MKSSGLLGSTPAPRAPSLRSLAATGLLWAIFLPLAGLAAPTLDVTPATLSVASVNGVIVHVAGLTSGDTIRFERILDVNGNGVVDAGDLIVQSCLVTDGVETTIGGQRDRNIPRDYDGAADGQISTLFNVPTSVEMARSIGSYLIRVSSPTSAFTPLTQPFTLTQSADAQSISGTVTSDGTTPVPHAIVGLVRTGNDGDYHWGVVANGSGQYTVNAPVGNYQTVALKPGFVANMGSSPIINLAAGQALTSNITMTAATRNISGQLRDSGNAAVTLPAVQLVAQSQSGLIAGAFSDASGNYSVGVTAAPWQVSASDNSLAYLGYLGPRNGPVADATAANVSDFTITFNKETALLYGNVKDSANTPLANIQIHASDSQHVYELRALTNANGNFSIGVIAGTWNLNVDEYSPGLAGYIPPGSTSATVTNGQAVQKTFVAQLPNAHLQGTVRNNGSPVPNLQIGASLQNSNTFLKATSDGSGNFDLGVVGGTWSIQLPSDSAAANNLVGAKINQTISNNQTISGIAYPVRTGTGTISGMVRDYSNNPVANASVYATATISSVLYSAGAQTDNSGHYTFPIINGTWLAGVNSTNSLNFNQQTAIVNFTPSVISSPPQNVLINLGGQASFSIGTNTSGSATLQWQVSTNGGGNWANVANGSPYSGATSNTLTINPVAAEMNGYRYRCVVTYNNGANSETSNGATLTVNDLLQITTFATLPDGEVGSIYSIQFNASGGQPPYHWYLPDGTVTLPPGSMSLSDDGVFAGIPTQVGTYDFVVGVGDYTWSSVVTKVMSLTVYETNIVPSFVSQPSNQTVNLGQSATFTALANGTPTPVYQWQLSTDNGSNWSDLANSSTYSGVNTGSLTVSAASFGQNGYRYRVIATNVAGVATSTTATLTVTASGAVMMWGQNTVGLLWSDSSTPVQVSGLAGVKALAFGSGFGLALKSDGTVWARGGNGSGQLGDGTGIERHTPVQVSGLSGVTAIGCGGEQGQALKGDGTVWAWGIYYSYQNGASNYFSHYTPAQISGLTDVRAIACGSAHSLALKNDATLWAWGNNSFGQLGDGTTTDRYTPVQVSGLTGVRSSTSGYMHSLALKKDGTVWAWGSNLHGELGDGTMADRNSPVQVSGVTGATAIAGGQSISLAIITLPVGSPTITTQPTNKTVVAGQPATFTVGVDNPPASLVQQSSSTGSRYLAASIPSDPTYQWQVSTDGGSNWNDLTNGAPYSGADTPTLTVTTSTGLNVYVYRCAVTNTVGITTSDAVVLTVHLGFEGWRALKFTAGELADSSKSGPNAIYGTDGLTNLVKYALGLDPKTTTTTGLPVTSNTANDWVYTYTCPSDRCDLAYAVEVSTDLINWTTSGVAHEYVFSSGGIETWRGRFSRASAPKVFFRLRVSRQ